MKKIKKQALVLLSVLICVFTLTACGKDDKISSEITDDMKNEFVKCVSDNTTTLGTSSIEDVDNMISSYETTGSSDTSTQEDRDALIAGLNSWKSAIEDAGDYKDLVKDANGDMKYTISGSGCEVSVKAKMQCEKRKVDIKYTFDKVDDNFKIISITYEPYYTFGEKMEKAALNTVMGISTVILVLAFLSVLISLFKYIGKAQKTLEDKKNNKNSDKTQVFEQIIEKESVSEEVIDDTEIVAVITAAIAASEKKSTDGFVVRSIRRAR